MVGRSDSSNPGPPDWPYEESAVDQAATSPVVASRGPSSLRPFHYRNYSLLWAGGMVSVIGSWMQTVAVGALVVAHTGKATWAVVIAAGAFLPIGLLSPVGGALADRIPRRAALVAGNLLAGAVALVIALLVAAGRDGPGVLTMLVTVQGAVSAMVGPFQQAILPDLVPPPEFLAAVSLNSAQFNLGRVIGPTLAGITIAAFGYPVAFVANAVSFLAVVVALFFVRLSPPPGHSKQNGLLASLRAGARAARSEPGCRATIGTIAVVALLASPFIALVPVMAHRLTDTGRAGLHRRPPCSRPPKAWAPSPGRSPSPLSRLASGEAGCSRAASRSSRRCSPFTALPPRSASRWQRSSFSGSCTSACRPACRQSCSSERRLRFAGVCSASTSSRSVSGIRSVHSFKGLSRTRSAWPGRPPEQALSWRSCSCSRG